MSKRYRESEIDQEASSSPKRTRVDHEKGQTLVTEISKKKLTTDDYTVGWICPLEVEQIAAMEMLDEEHERLPQAPTDHNVYNLGSIAGHNVVIAGLYQAGNNPAATVVAQMRTTFQNLKFGVLVGIGGGVPVKTDNGMIRLGDVVVSKPAGEHSGAVQYDHGKVRAGEFERTGILAPPPRVLLSAAQDLAAKRARSSVDPVQDNIKRINTNIRGLRKYKHPGTANDHLYEADYIHLSLGLSCEKCGCDPSKRVQRPTDDEDDDGSHIVVHRGTIASGEAVIKDAILRDELAEEHGLLCFEMEAAGALADFPCLVIRGISDYCDSHKNDQWHGYAAAAAAAYSRQLFFHMPIDEVKRYISETAEKTIHHMHRRQEDQDRQKVLEWLSPTNFPAQQHDIVSRRQDGTAQWFLDSVEFQEWLQGSNKTLFCPGLPGAGKTMMAAVAVDFLNQMTNMNETGIACLFCSYKAQVNQSAANLFAAILKQLVQARPSLAEPIERLHKKHAARGTRPSLDELVSGLRDVLERSATVHIVIDALDECPQDFRHQFLTKLQNLQAGRNIRIIVTSRFIPEVEDAFKEALRLEVQASKEDVKCFVAGQIHRLPKCIQNDPALQKLVQDRIMEAVDGMFILARLHVESLIAKRTPKAVEEAVARFSKGSNALNDAYSTAIERIEGQPSDDFELAKNVLSWITFAKRPLTTAELCCALAVEPGAEGIDPKNKPFAEDLASVCAGLVVVDQESAFIRLVHYTTQEYFEGIWEFQGKIGNTYREHKQHWDINTPLRIASTCLTYLSFSAFANGSCSTNEEFEARLQQNEFLDYAAKHWGEHAVTVEDQICELACLFLSQGPLVSCAVQVLFRSTYTYDDNSEKYSKGKTGLHLASRFGLSIISKTLLPSKEREIAIALAKRDSFGTNVLYIAAAYGHERMVKLLLDNSADVNAQGGYYGNALQAASFGGYEAVVKLLLDKGVDVNAQGGYYGNALQAASFGGYEAVVKLLLDKGADVNAQGGYCGNALQAASIRGYEAVVKLLLNKGADVNAQGGYYGNALQVASIGGYEAVVKLLLDTGADVNAQSRSYGNALQAASEEGHEVVVKMLLDKGADVNSQGKGFSNALSAASEAGNVVVVKLLLDNGADVNAHRGLYSNALQAASFGGNEAVVKLLLDKGADVNAHGRGYSNALSVASEEGHEAIAKLLLDKGADVDAQGGFYSNALQAASFRGYEAVVKLLLDKGADVNARGRSYGNALQAASFGGYEAVVKLLLDKGAVVNAQGGFYGNALRAASQEGHEAVVKLLLDKGADVNAQGGCYCNALYAASHRGYKAIVKLLLDKGADVNAQGGYYSNALQAASSKGHEAVVKLLLENGAVPEPKTRSEKRYSYRDK